MTLLDIAKEYDLAVIVKYYPAFSNYRFAVSLGGVEYRKGALTEANTPMTSVTGCGYSRRGAGEALCRQIEGWELVKKGTVLLTLPTRLEFGDLPL